MLAAGSFHAVPNFRSPATQPTRQGLGFRGLGSGFWVFFGVLGLEVFGFGV